MLSPYLTGNTLRLRYKSQLVNTLWGKFTHYCEIHTEHTDTLCWQNAEVEPHGKHITSPLQTQPVNALWGNIRCSLSEKYGTHRYRVCAECRDCNSQEIYYVSTTKTNRLMLFGETLAVYCEKHTEKTDKLCGQNVEFVPHRNSLILRFKAQPVNAVWGTVAVYCENHTEHTNTLYSECIFCTSQLQITSPLQNSTG
jgi:hypothetical protein